MCGFDEEDITFDIVNVNNIEWGRVVRGDPITQNHALARRFGIGMSSKVIRTIGCIHFSIFEQPKALPPFTELEVTFERNKDEFMLLSKNDNQHYWLHMQRMNIITHKMHLQESLSDDIMQVVNAGKNYLYPIRRVRMVLYSKGPAVQEFSQTNILPGVTEYSDPPENPGTGPDFTENMGSPHNVLPLTQGAEACLSSGLSLTLEPSDNRAISTLPFPLT